MIKMNEVDVVLVGAGWTGGILGKELAEAGMRVVCLERGGPQRDRLGVDPDGDGFACSWNPTPFRAVQN